MVSFTLNFLIHNPNAMEAIAVIDLETLTRVHGEVLKEFSVVGKYAQETFRFLPPYTMEPHGSTSSGINWNDGSALYSSLVRTLNEATANFANLYCKGIAKCRFLTDLFDCPITNLDDFGCPPRESFVPVVGCSLPCHRFPDKICAVRNARSLFGWLKHHLKTNVKCTKDYTRHTEKFNSDIQK
jgi:hypothetical protein